MTLTLRWPLLLSCKTKLSWCLVSQINIFNIYDLDPMTLMLKLDLYIVKMYHRTKNEVSRSTCSKVVCSLNTQTHRHNETTKTLSLPHTRVLINMPFLNLDFLTHNSWLSQYLHYQKLFKFHMKKLSQYVRPIFAKRCWGPLHWIRCTLIYKRLHLL